MEWKQKRATTFCPILHPIPPNHLHHYNPPCVYPYLHLTPAPHPVTLSEPIKINSCRKTARSINIIKYPHAFEKKLQEVFSRTETSQHPLRLDRQVA